jgi:hypothetical protein
MDIRDFTIDSRESISAFFTYLIKELNLNFHPDNAFSDYINTDNQITFTIEEGDHLEKILELCFDWCFRNDADIYEIGLESLYLFINEQDEE